MILPLMEEYIRAHLIGDRCVMTKVSGSGGKYEWEASGSGFTVSGDWTGDPIQAEIFALMSAAEELKKPAKVKHRGRVFAAHDAKGGLVLELDAKGKFFDCGLRFKDQAEARKYADGVNAEALQ